MKKRLITSMFILLGFGVAFVSRIWTLYVFDLLMMAMAVMGAVEVGRVLERQGKYVNFVAVASMPAVLYLLFTVVIRLNLIWQYLLIFFLSALLVYFAVIFTVTMCAKKTTQEEMKKYELSDEKPYRYAIDKAVYSLTVLIYPSLLFMALIMINHFYELSFIAGMGYDFNIFTWFMLTSVFVVTIMTDTMAYVVGSTVKGPKLCPLISPNKTISGAIGGLVGGVASGMGLYGLFCINDIFKVEMFAIGCEWWILLAVFVLGSILSQIGDILASALKRRARVKDYGTIFPGHGGIMDRMDGNIFNAFLSLVSFMLIFLV